MKSRFPLRDCLPGKAIHQTTRTETSFCLCDLRVFRGSFLLQRKRARNQMKDSISMNCS